jgi:calcineurin-like phosphoesterase family protein
VENQRGMIWSVTKDILEHMKSASSFEKTIAMTRTELVELLQELRDQIFTINFKKKVKESEILFKLEDLDLNKKNFHKELSKTILEGEDCTIVGCKSKATALFGRTMVKDLRMRKGYQYR